jgi:hypothetical protein
MAIVVILLIIVNKGTEDQKQENMKAVMVFPDEFGGYS